MLCERLEALPLWLYVWSSGSKGVGSGEGMWRLVRSGSDPVLLEIGMELIASDGCSDGQILQIKNKTKINKSLTPQLTGIFSMKYFSNH